MFTAWQMVVARWALSGWQTVRLRDLMQSSQFRTWSPVCAQPRAETALSRRIDSGSAVTALV